MRRNKIAHKCDCREYVFRNGQLVCKFCNKPMQSAKKPITAKGLRHKSGMYEKR